MSVSEVWDGIGVAIGISTVVGLVVLVAFMVVNVVVAALIVACGWIERLRNGPRA